MARFLVYRARYSAFELVFLIVLATTTTTVTAASFNWNNPAGGAFNVSGNWLPVGFPGAGDDVLFDLDGTYTVTFPFGPFNNSLRVIDDNVTFDLNGSIYQLTSTILPSIQLTPGTSLGDNASLTVTDGALQGNAVSINAIGGVGSFPNSTLTASSGGRVIADNFLIRGSGIVVPRAIAINGGVFESNSVFLADVLNGSVAEIVVSGSGSQWINTGQITIGNSESGNGLLSLVSGGLFDNGSSVLLRNSGRIQLNGGTLRAARIDYQGGDISFSSGAIELSAADSNLVIGVGEAIGTTVDMNAGDSIIIAGTIHVEPTGTLRARSISTGKLINEGTIFVEDNLFGPDDLVNNGTLVLESNLTLDLEPNNFRGDGTLDVNSRTMTLPNNSLAQLGTRTTLAGGTLTSFALTLQPGSELEGFGTVAANVIVPAGGIVSAEGGALTLGDPTFPIGFYSDGVLSVQNGNVTILDSNEAKLGPLTLLGENGTPRTLVAAGGLVIDFGSDVTGHGLLDTTNDPLKPVILNGRITGDSTTNRITLDGYVKGIGTLANVDITGTYAPGLSPSSVDLAGLFSLSSSAILEIEIGGDIPGAEFDRLKSIGSILVAGILDVNLIGGFTPSIGDSFEIITTMGGVTGVFDTLSASPLPGGLEWRIVYHPTTVSLHVALPGDFDLDGDVDSRDFLVWQRNPSVGNLADWQANYGTPLLATAIAVPEPCAGGILMAISAVLLLSRMKSSPRGKLWSKEFDCVR